MYTLNIGDTSWFFSIYTPPKKRKSGGYKVVETQHFKIYDHNLGIYIIDFTIEEPENERQIKEKTEELKKEWASINPKSTIRMVIISQEPNQPMNHIFKEYAVNTYLSDEPRTVYTINIEYWLMWKIYVHGIIRAMSYKKIDNSRLRAVVLATIKDQ